MAELVVFVVTFVLAIPVCVMTYREAAGLTKKD